MVAQFQKFIGLPVLAIIVFLVTLPSAAETTSDAKPVELEVLKGYVGVWDADIEVWPKGPDAPSMSFKGVETIHAYGEYWLVSDFDTEFNGQTNRIHSIVGYDLDKGMLVGTIIDQGPYAATMSGEYDSESKAVHWTTHAKGLDGTPMVQKTAITQKNADERVLVLSTPNKDGDGETVGMKITFTKRK
jgi:hypothetical protein